MKKILLVLALLISSTQAKAAVDLAVFVTDNTTFNTLSTFSLGYGASLGFHLNPKWSLVGRGFYQNNGGTQIYGTGQLNYHMNNVFDLGVQAGIASTTVTVSAFGLSTSATATSLIYGPHAGLWFGNPKMKFGFDFDYLLNSTSTLGNAIFQGSAGLKFMI